MPGKAGDPKEKGLAGEGQPTVLAAT